MPVSAGLSGVGGVLLEWTFASELSVGRPSCAYFGWFKWLTVDAVVAPRKSLK
jgi:hypothetical protein